MGRIGILGAGGHGKVVADAALSSGWESIVVYDDGWPSEATSSLFPIIGNSEALKSDLGSLDGVIIAIGDNNTRATKFQELERSGANIVSIIHPSAIISRFAEIGPGCLVSANAVINASVRISKGCIINSGSIIEHDCLIGDFAHIGPGAVLAGNVTIKGHCLVGAGVAIKPDIHIGTSALVGTGAVVTKNVVDTAIVIGNPARPK